MFKTYSDRVYLLIALLSAAFSYLIITLNFFPFLGVSMSLVVFATLAYRFIKKGPDTKLFFIFSVIFSIFMVIRSNPFTTFLNFWSAIFFGMLMLASGGERSKGFFGYVFIPVSLLFNTLFTKSKYFLGFDKSKTDFKKINYAELIFGVAASIMVLVVILPLLASTNPIFSKTLTDFSNIFNLRILIEKFGYETMFVWCVRLFFFFCFLFVIPKILTLIGKDANYSLPSIVKLQSFPLQIPKIVTAVVLVIFFVTQLQLYFATDQTLTQLGMGYSQRTREVFGQLSVVAVVVFVLMYNSQLKNQLSRKLNWILGIEGIFLTLMAYKSDFEYIMAHGLTYIRLYGLVIATLVTGVYVLYKKYFVNSNFDFVRGVVIFFGSVFVLVNLLNFDYLIYHFNKPRVGGTVDFAYLSRLSSDSLSYEEQFKLLEQYTFDKNFKGAYKNEMPLVTLYQIEYLQRKYSDIDLRTFNLFEFLQYQKIKNIDTSKLRDYYTADQVQVPLRVR